MRTLDQQFQRGGTYRLLSAPKVSWSSRQISPKALHVQPGIRFAIARIVNQIVLRPAEYELPVIAARYKLVGVVHADHVIAFMRQPS